VGRKALIDLWAATNRLAKSKCGIRKLFGWDLGLERKCLPQHASSFFFKESWQKGGEKGMAEMGAADQHLTKEKQNRWEEK
jgi:hypothetical protein